MLEQLIHLFGRSHPLQATGEKFERMQEIVRGMVTTASGVYWGALLSSEERLELYATDKSVNQLEREISGEVTLHLSGPGASDVPYGLMLMGLIRDIERLGDYAKSLSEVHKLTGLCAGDLPAGHLRDDLGKIRDFVEMLTDEAHSVYTQANEGRARVLLDRGREIAQLCDDLYGRIAESHCSSALAVNMTLATRYYKRIAAHMLSILESLLMPLDELDGKARLR